MSEEGVIKKYWHIACYLFCPLLFIVGIIININEEERLAKLKETSGRIFESSIHYSHYNYKYPRWYVKLKYSYWVAGKKFENDKISLLEPACTQKSEADSISRFYCVGKTLPVFYLSDNPQTAYLEKNEIGWGWTIIAVSIIIMIIVTPVIWFLRKEQLKKD